MPSLLSADQRRHLEVLGATHARLVRGGCDLLEALAAVTHLVLVLEDLHWSDLATLDLLAALGRRRENRHS
ncbi:MAG: hypothetical protein PHT19_13770 [Methylococcus sp.]|nr:hypothetical protein [Methylococcus sp.]